MKNSGWSLVTLLVTRDFLPANSTNCQMKKSQMTELKIKVLENQRDVKKTTKTLENPLVVAKFTITSAKNVRT